MLYDVKSLDVCKMKKADPTTPGYEPCCNVKVRNSRRKAKINGIDWNTQEAFFIFLFVDKKYWPGRLSSIPVLLVAKGTNFKRTIPGKPYCVILHLYGFNDCILHTTTHGILI